MDMDNIKKTIDRAFDKENNTKRYILTCSCFRMDKKAAEAFTTIFPNKVLPTIIKGRDRIGKMAKAMDNDHITAISRLSGKFAFYVELEGDKIIKEYNLLTGKRIG